MKRTSLYLFLLITAFVYQPDLCFADGEPGETEPEDNNIVITVNDEEGDEEGDENDDKTENYPHRAPSQGSGISGTYYSSSSTLLLSISSSVTDITRITIRINNQTVINDLSPILPLCSYFLGTFNGGLCTVTVYTASGRTYQGTFITI